MRYVNSLCLTALALCTLSHNALAQDSGWKSLDDYIERVTLGEEDARTRYAIPAPSYEPSLSAGSTFFVDIKNVEELSGSFTANEQGQVDFPMIGPIVVAGLNPEGLAITLQTIYGRDLLQSPKITVTIPEKKTDDIMIITGEGERKYVNLKQPEPVLDVLKREGFLKGPGNIFPIYIFQDELDKTRTTIITEADAANPRYKGPLAYPKDRIILWDWRTLFTSHPSLKRAPYLNALMQVKIRTLPAPAR